MQFLQPTITDEQAQLLLVGVNMLLQDDKYVLSEEEEVEYQRLGTFLSLMISNPSAFAPTGKAATAVRSIIRKAKGTTQPKTKNKRKARQERRQGAQKARRAQRREFAAAWNAAVEALEAERAEAEQAEAELRERLANEPKFNVVNENGHVLMAEIPQSMIVSAQDMAELVTGNQVVLPPGVDAA